MLTLGEAPSNTHLFLCFHNHQATSMIIELNPLESCLGTCCRELRHQKKNTWSSGPGVSCCRPTIESTENQTSLANTQAVSKCYTFSSSWSQRGQCSGWSRPRRASRSAVQHRFKEANHKKNLQRGGAQDFEISFQGSNSTAPTKKRRYADLVVNSPEGEAR